MEIFTRYLLLAKKGPWPELEVFEDIKNGRIRIVSSSLQLDEDIVSAFRNPGTNSLVLNSAIGLELSAQDASDFQEVIMDTYGDLITTPTV